MKPIPWDKIQFKTETNHIYDGYIYDYSDGLIYVSQNQSPETAFEAQTWIINENQIIKFY